MCQWTCVMSTFSLVLFFVNLRDCLARLQRTLQRVSDDLIIKENTLDIDIHCMQLRQQKLNDCDSSLSQEFDAIRPAESGEQGVTAAAHAERPAQLDTAEGSEVPQLSTAGSSTSTINSTAQSTARSG